MFGDDDLAADEEQRGPIIKEGSSFLIERNIFEGMECCGGLATCWCSQNIPKTEGTRPEEPTT